MVDVREVALDPDAPARLASLKDAHPEMEVLFFDASDAKMIRRFKETRRRHALIGSGDVETLAEAVARERELLQPIRALARVVVDTSTLTVHDLKRRVRELYVDPAENPMQLHLQSFGFRHGLPLEADYVFDVRFLPNPYFVEELRSGTGLDEPVARYVLEHAAAQMMLQHIEDMLVDVLPLAAQEGKTAVTVAIGCTGGHHRSVALVEALRGRLARRDHAPTSTHRDIER